MDTSGKGFGCPEYGGVVTWKENSSAVQRLDHLSISYYLYCLRPFKYKFRAEASSMKAITMEREYTKWYAMECIMIRRISAIGSYLEWLCPLLTRESQPDVLNRVTNLSPLIWSTLWHTLVCKRTCAGWNQNLHFVSKQGKVYPSWWGWRVKPYARAASAKSRNERSSFNDPLWRNTRMFVIPPQVSAGWTISKRYSYVIPSSNCCIEVVRESKFYDKFQHIPRIAVRIRKWLYIFRDCILILSAGIMNLSMYSRKLAKQHPNMESVISKQSCQYLYSIFFMWREWLYNNGWTYLTFLVKPLSMILYQS